MNAVIKPNAVSGAIVRALVPLAEGKPIYDERMLQGFEEPCFFVIETSVNELPDYGDYLWREHRVEVSYFPRDEAMTDRKGLAYWRLQLLEKLASIEVDALDEGGKIQRIPVYARDPECRFIEDHIVYFASYRLRCIRQQAAVELMASLETHSQPKI